MIVTRRLTLVPATLALARAELHDRPAFADLLGAVVPAAWPPETVVDALPLFLGWLEAAPDRIGWFGWYALCRDTCASGLVLVGGGGFLGPPEDGVVQMGYSVLPEFQRRGYATEMVRGLATWAFVQPDVTAIAAETEWANPASVRVLERAGFQPAGTASDPAGARFELRVTPPVAAGRIHA
jgi:ribosomal-protein-alanine N-acetyltransferase